MQNKRKYFITGGGTGGHIYPAMTIADKLLKDETTEKVYFIGNPKNLEYEISKQYPDLEFLGVNVSGMPRKLSLNFIKWAFQLLFSIIKTITYIKKYNPDAIFATGGYVSAPAVLAARILNKPYMIHDCDSVPGIVSKISAPKAKIVSIAFETSKNVLKSKNIICNGNPVREEFFTITKNEARQNLNITPEKKVIFAMGGSQGAKTINNAMINLLETLSSESQNYIIMQTGKKNYDEVINELEKIFPQYKEKSNIMIKPYFDKMVYPLKASDIVISRAGSVSLSEIIQCQCASILVPYPYAAQDHQRKNAKEMFEKGISLYLEDSECNKDNLFEKIKEIDIESINKKLKDLAQNNPTEKITEQLKSIIK